MDSFINRGSELRLIEDAFGDLLNKETILRTPIIDFYGVEGIGKTSILQKVLQSCDKNNIRYIWADASKTTPELFHEIITQAKQYGETLPSHVEGNLRDQSVAVTRALLGKGPLVILLDAVETTNEAQLEPIEEMLSGLVMNNRLFVVLTSRRSVPFKRERNVARKLTTFPLLPLNRDSSEEYLNSLGLPLDHELREIIFAWTRGYPLAMNVMANAIKEQGIDPRNEQGRLTLLETITHRVIDQGILARVEQAEQPWFRTVLNLLSVPRRFNLLIMQKLVERFAPELKLANSLAYIVLPKRIAQSTDVLSWNLARGGFSIDSPVRNIFLLQLKIQHPDNFYEINKFLAQINQTNAEEVSGPDRIRYQREYLFHIANSGDEAQLPHLLATTVQRIIKDAEITPEHLIQFREEFIQDVELQELLGEHSNIILSPIHKELAQKMYKNAEQEADEEKRARYLHDFFSYTVCYTVQDTTANDLALRLKEHISQLIAQERPAIVLKLYEELARDEKFREALGQDFSVLLARIRNNMQTEG